MRGEEVTWSQIRRLLGLKTVTVFGAVALLLGFAIYVGEQVIRANPELIPAKAQGIASITSQAQYRTVPDREVGFLGPPHLRTRVSTEDFENLQETDAHGFPNRMPWPETANIVVLGDSLVVGAGVGIDGQFSTLIAQSLPNTQIVNLGIPGAAPNRQLRVFRKFGASLRSKLVVSCIYLAAALDNQYHFDSWLKEGAKADYNQYRFDLARRQYPKSFWTKVQRKSYIAGKLTELALRWWGIPDRIHFPSGPDALLDIESFRSRVMGIDRQDSRMLSMVDSLNEIRTLSQSGGARFLVVLIPSKEEIYGAPFMPGVLKPAHILEQRLREEEFSVLSLYDAIRDKAKNQPAFFPHDIHLNAFGNQIVADALVNWIKKSGMFPYMQDSSKTSVSRDGSHASLH